MTKEENYKNLAEGISTLFSPMAEVALYHDEKQIALFNRLLNEKFSLENNNVTKIARDKKQFKGMQIPLDKDYFLRIVVDVTLFDSLQSFLQNYLMTSELIEGDPLQLIDSHIEKYLAQHNTSLQALESREKRALILHLQERNLLRYQESTKYLAQKLDISRATLYNYLKQANELKSVEVHQVDSFTDEPFSGNPAGVVLEADHLSLEMMKKIAREMNLSETAFVFKSKVADIKLRYFTPSGAEVKFCGHSTVGVLYMLAHKRLFGINRPRRHELTLEANIGLIQAAVTLKSDESVVIEFQTPKISLVKSKISHHDIAEALGIALAAIDQTKPIFFEKNNQDLYVTITSLKDLGTLQIDQKKAKQFAEKYDIVVIVLVCNETVVKGNHIHMRCFAPAVGIPEDPFTGSVLGGLASYVKQTKLIPALLKMIRIEQGHFISRPGYVDLNISKSPPQVIAKARHFFSTEIKL